MPTTWLTALEDRYSLLQGIVIGCVAVFLLALVGFESAAFEAEAAGSRALSMANGKKVEAEADQLIKRTERNFVYINGWMDGWERRAPNAF